jgi:hypothetical protein
VGGEQWNTDQVSDDEENQSQDNHVIRFQLQAGFPLGCGVAGGG